MLIVFQELWRRYWNAGGITDDSTHTSWLKIWSCFLPSYPIESQSRRRPVNTPCRKSSRTTFLEYFTFRYHPASRAFVSLWEQYHDAGFVITPPPIVTYFPGIFIGEALFTNVTQLLHNSLDLAIISVRPLAIFRCRFISSLKPPLDLIRFSRRGSTGGREKYYDTANFVDRKFN